MTPLDTADLVPAEAEQVKVSVTPGVTGEYDENAATSIHTVTVSGARTAPWQSLGTGATVDPTAEVSARHAAFLEPAQRGRRFGAIFWLAILLATASLAALAVVVLSD